MEKYRVCVTGGRDYGDREHVFAVLDEIHSTRPITHVVHGACCDKEGRLRGADRWAEEWAITRQIRYSGEPAKWDIWDTAAGPKRNFVLANDWRPDTLLVFPGNRGTKNMVETAKKAQVSITYHDQIQLTP